MSAATETTVWRLDPGRSRIAFGVRQGWLPRRAHGRFHEASGWLVRDGAGGGFKAGGMVRVAGLATGDERRDRHLLSQDFLDAAAHPQIRFAAEGRLEPPAVDAAVTGRLTIKGTTHDVALRVDAECRAEVLELRATGRLDRRRWGVQASSLDPILISRRVDLELRLVAVVVAAGREAGR